MMAKRVVAIAADRALGKRIVASAMAAGGAAELVAQADELHGRFDAELFVVATAAGDPALASLLSSLPEDALYDAPVDESGKPVFAEVAVKDRIGMAVQEKAVVQYGCDGERFALSVRDAYGSIRKVTILSFLDKCLHTAGLEQIDRKT